MKKNLVIIVVAIASIALTAGIVKAASLTVDSLTVGKQGVGGVTYFNGTIINNTKGTGNSDNPVTFGDNVRIDGYVFRGPTAGAGDSKPFKINDDEEVVGNLTVGGNSTISGSSTITGGSTVTGNETVGGNLTVTGNLTVSGTIPGAKQKLYSGTIDLTANGDEMVNTAEGTCLGSPVKNYTTHFKKISVPEVDITNMPTVRVFTKPIASPIPPAALPNSGDVWSAAGYVYLTQGYVYIGYKYSVNLCDGTIQTTVNLMASGDYRLLVVYQ